MKSLIQFAAAVCTGVLLAASAQASALQLNPERPAVGQPFTIDFHISATMPGLAEGTYPIYTSVGVLNGLGIPSVDTLLQGGVTVTGSAPSSVPTLSFWGLALLVLAMALCMRRNWNRRPRRSTC